MKYHIWTEGCQMNAADSQRVAAALENLGYRAETHPEQADVIVLNTCVVRQSAEDKAYGRLSSLRPLKEKRPELVINLMGCLVGIKSNQHLKERFPYVDVFSPPSDPTPLLAYLNQAENRQLEMDVNQVRNAALDGELLLPIAERGKLVSAFVPVVLGCSHACSFCVIPYRRGIEHSRPLAEIVKEVSSLVDQGVKEVTLLGQIVDRYGVDLTDGANLSRLLRSLSEIDGLKRIRFLTSHPSYLDQDLLEAVAELPKVMPHIEVPVQSGDDQVLEQMKRGYTQQAYRDLVGNIRNILGNRQPGVSIATDIIVGFPGESEGQFLHTYELLADLQLDVAHLARYSPRPDTLAARRLPDDVPESEKMRRYRLLEELQEGIAAAINHDYLGQTVEVLFEEQVRGRWKGRTSTNKLVFLESNSDLRGKVLPVTITWTGPWSMQSAYTTDPIPGINKQPNLATVFQHS